MRKATNNYIVDVIIGLAFIASAISGLAFLLPYDILPISSEGIAVLFGLSLRVWNDIHTVSSLMMITGVGLHLVLHWQWIVAMTNKLLGIGKQAQRKSPVIATATRAKNTGDSNDVSRRQFLALGGGAALGMLLGWNIKGLFENDNGDSESALSSVTEVEPATVVDEQPAVLSESATGQPESASANAESTLAQVETPAIAEVEETAEVVTPEPTEAASVVEDPTATPIAKETTAPVTTFTCPKGLINDPYPGRCRHYLDENGNGYCDYSQV